MTLKLIIYLKILKPKNVIVRTFFAKDSHRHEDFNFHVCLDLIQGFEITPYESETQIIRNISKYNSILFPDFVLN